MRLDTHHAKLEDAHLLYLIADWIRDRIIERADTYKAILKDEQASDMELLKEGEDAFKHQGSAIFWDGRQSCSAGKNIRYPPSPREARSATR